MLLSLTLLLPSLLPRVNGQFPMVCPLDFSNFGLTTCCPVWPGDGSVCGSNSGRGYCRTAPANRPTQPDERMGYPWGLYRATCACYGNYKGHDCGGCIHNYWGDKCDMRYNVRRKEVRNAPPAEFEKFRDAIVRAKTTTSSWCGIFTQQGTGSGRRGKMVRASMFDCLAAAHAFNSKNFLDQDQDFIHSGPGFFPWHRWHLLEFEQMMQILLDDRQFGLYYWDWRFDIGRCGICTGNLFGTSDAAGNIGPPTSVFSNWPIICENSAVDSYCMMPEPVAERAVLMREPTVWETRLPTYDNVSDCLKWRPYDRWPYNERAQMSFRNCAEGFVEGDGVTYGLGVHNRVHLFMGGHMLSTQIAASDPVFYLHHCMIDSIWEQWIKDSPAGASTIPPNSIPGQGPEDYIVGSQPPAPLKYYMQSSQTFGYVYDYHAPLN